MFPKNAIEAMKRGAWDYLAKVRVIDVAGNATDRPVTIRDDARATHQSVVTAMDVAAHLGFTQVNIATISQQTEE